MACTSHTLRTAFVAALAIASIGLAVEAACKNEGTCESIGPAVGAPGNALIQTKKTAEGIKIQTKKNGEEELEQISAPVALAHLVDSRTCIPPELQEASIAALRHHAALLANGARTPRQNPLRFVPACATSPPKGDCNLTMNGYEVPGKCDVFGMDQKQHCEIGQFKACADAPQGSTDHKCNVYGMTGTCVSVTGYMGTDENGYPKNIFRYGCDMAQESTLDISLLPGAPPTAEPPKPGPPTLEPPMSLTAADFKEVTSLCCPVQMEAFFNRLLGEMGLQVCSKPHIQGLMHWFTCVPDLDFQYVLDVINKGNPCKYWAPKGAACPALTPQCQGNWCR